MSAYRHELKYYISCEEAMLLSRRLSLTLDADRHAMRVTPYSGMGEYHIRSLYFDDLDNSAFCDKLDGADNRDKFRIRIYDMSDRVIKLERKHKQGQGYIKKDSVSITRQECEALILGGDIGFLLRERGPGAQESAFAREIYTLFSGGRYVPRVIVDYVREPYVYMFENTRVSVDKEIHTAYYSTDLFDPHVPTFPVLDAGLAVLEIKFDYRLPEYVRLLVQTSASERSAVSKYVLCRQLEL